MPYFFIGSFFQLLKLICYNIEQVGEKRIIADFSGMYEVEETDKDGVVFKVKHYKSGRTLIDMETGILYDFSEYTNPQGSNWFFADGNTLYAIKRNYSAGVSTGALYKIDLTNIGTAIPLNNPEFISVASISVKVGDRVICSTNGGYYSFDSDGILPPKEVIGDTLWLQVGNYFIDSKNDVWGYDFFVVIGSYYDKYKIYKITIDDNGQLDKSYLPDGTFSSIPEGVYSNTLFISSSDGSSRFYIASGGVVIVKKDPSGSGIKIEGIAKTISANRKDEFIHNNYLYWLDESSGKSINRLELIDSSTAGTIYSDSSIVTSIGGQSSGKKTISLSGNKIIFYQYFSATSVGTYSLSLSDLSALPVLISTSNAEVDNIIELKF